MFYVYEHIRNDTNQCFYVGKGTKDRCVVTRQRNKYWQNIVKKAGGFTIEIVEKDLDAKTAIELEIKRIAMYKDLGAKLCNMTQGGDGFASGDLNPAKRSEVRKLLSENVSGDKNPFKRADVRSKISGENHHMKTKLHRKRMSEQNPNLTAVRHLGILYPSLKALSEAIGENYGKVRKRFQKNPAKWGYEVIK